MTKMIKSSVIVILFVITPLLMLGQNPPHPNGGSAPGGGNTPVGGGAPIDGGISFLMILGAAYGSRKAYKAFKS